MAQRIQFTDDELMVLISWVFNKESKPQKDHPTDKKLIKKLKNACEREYMEEEWDFWAGDWDNEIVRDEMGNDITEELKQRKASVENKEGIFYCPNCKIKTNEKTYKTRCVICDTSLMRGGGV